jgi:hypothetical protein
MNNGERMTRTVLDEKQKEVQVAELVDSSREVQILIQGLNRELAIVEEDCDSLRSFLPLSQQRAGFEETGQSLWEKHNLRIEALEKRKTELSSRIDALVQEAHDLDKQLSSVCETSPDLLKIVDNLEREHIEQERAEREAHEMKEFKGLMAEMLMLTKLLKKIEDELEDTLSFSSKLYEQRLLLERELITVEGASAELIVTKLHAEDVEQQKIDKELRSLRIQNKEVVTQIGILGEKLNQFAERVKEFNL